MALNHEELLAAYRGQLADIEKKLRVLSRERQAVSAIVQGLEMLTGKVTARLPTAQPTATDSVIAFLKNQANQGSQAVLPVPDTAGAPDEMSTLGRAIRLLRRIPRKVPMGAKDIQRGIAHQGNDVNYQTLYKALRRESERPDGLIFQRDEKFGLREWAATSGSRTDR